MTTHDDGPAVQPPGPFTELAAGLSKVIAAWSAVVGVAVGLTFAVGAALLTARLFESYGVTPTAVLTSLPRGFILETGIEHVILPAGVCVLALEAARRATKDLLPSWTIPTWAAVVGVAVVTAIPSAIGVRIYPHRQHPIPAVERFLTGWLFLLAFLLIIAELSRLVGGVLAGRQGDLKILAFTTQLLVIAGFVIAIWAYVPLPEGVACGSGNTFTYIYATSDTVYAAELARSSATRVEEGSGFLAIIPSAQAKTVLVGHHVGLRNCSVAYALPVVIEPAAGRTGVPVWATEVASDPVDHLRGGTHLTLGCSDQVTGPHGTTALGRFAQINSTQDSADWIDLASVVLPDGRSPDPDLLALPACD
jgi:hypothetical protein